MGEPKVKASVKLRFMWHWALFAVYITSRFNVKLAEKVMEHYSRDMKVKPEKYTTIKFSEVKNG